MIEINLLPEEIRRKKAAYPRLDLDKDRSKIIALSAAVGLMMAAVLFLMIYTGLRKRAIVRLKAEQARLAPQTSKIETINNEITALRSKINTIESITKKEFLWARKLNELSDMVLPGMWFTRIYTDSENRLIIEGSVISKKEEAMSTIGKFMKNAGDNRMFFKDFSNMKLESIQREDSNEKDVVDFRIALYF